MSRPRLAAISLFAGAAGLGALIGLNSHSGHVRTLVTTAAMGVLVALVQRVALPRDRWLAASGRAILFFGGAAVVASLVAALDGR